MIDYSKINDPEYFKDILSDISQVTDVATLSNLLKILSIKISNKEVDPVDANILLSAIKERNKTLTDIHYQKRSNRRENDNNDTEGGRVDTNDVKQLTLSPTSVSNRVGTASIVLILVNIAVTIAMYAILVVARLIK